MIFKDKPLDFKQEIEVVACHIESGGKFVLLRRLSHKTNGNKWGLPAGKREAGETTKAGVVREIQEETGLVIPQDNLKYLGSLYVRNEGHDIFYHTFSSVLSERPTIVINPSEHSEFCWVSPTEALELDLIHDLDECIELFYC